MSQLHTIHVGETLRSFGATARADGSPIIAGTVNYFLKAKTGDNAGKWWRDSDETWRVAETANAMTHEADGAWTIDLASSPFVHGDAYLEYAKESGDLHIPANHRLLKAMAAPGTTNGVATTGDVVVTVVVSAASVAATAANDSGRLTLVRFTTFRAQITGLGSLAARNELYFSIKRSPGRSDDNALIRISEGVGLERVNGAAADDAADGSLVVDDEADGDITIEIDETITAALSLFDNAVYDIKIVRTNGDVDVLTSVDYPAGATTRARCLDPVTNAIA